MKQKLLLKTMLLLCALIAGSSSVWAVEAVYKAALFGSAYNSSATSAYTGTWYSTNYGFRVDLANFNNNNNGWNYVKCGRKNNASVATIITNAAIDKAITKVDVVIDAITASNVNSIKLYTSSNGSTWSEAGSFTKATGTKSVSLTSPAADLYYKIEFDCASGSSNGLVTVSKVKFYYNASETHTFTYSATNGTITAVDISNDVVANGASIAKDAKISLTAAPVGGYVFSSWDVSGEGSALSSTTTNPTVMTMGTADALVTAHFDVDIALAPPTIFPAAGAVTAGTTVTLTQAAADQIRYTTDGTDPTKTTGTIYSTPIAITSPTTIKAIAIKGDDTSDIASAAYTISVTKPTILPAAGAVEPGTLLTITATDGNTIRYTTDGTAPTKTTGKVYSTSISINRTMTVKAIAVDGYDNESAVTSAAYTVTYPGGVDITPNYSFFGKAAQFSGNTYDEVSGQESGVVVTYTRNTGSCYANASAMRFYKDNDLKIDAPTGKSITTILLDATSTDITSSPTTYDNESSMWTGNANSVTLSRPSDASSYVTISKITVVLANKATIAAACTDGEGMYYGTYSSDKAFKVPADLVVSEITVDNGKLQLSDYSTGDVVPANTGVMIASDAAKSYTLEIATGGTSKLGSDNMLKPSGDAGIEDDDMAAASASGTKFYRLTMHNGTQIGFWWGAASGAAFDLDANKAYLAVPESALATAPSLLWFDNGSTGVDEVRGKMEEVRGDFFDLQGRKVANPTKGLYIVNGKKVVIK